MKLSELPTQQLRNLAARCEGLDAAGGDGRIVLKAVSAMCYAEIQQRVEGKDFPILSEAAAASFALQINTSKPTAFALLLYELEA